MKVILLCVLAIVCATAAPALIWPPLTFLKSYAETLVAAALTCPCLCTNQGSKIHLAPVLEDTPVEPRPTLRF